MPDTNPPPPMAMLFQVYGSEVCAKQGTAEHDSSSPSPTGAKARLPS
jgi:hypothetical protein